MVEILHEKVDRVLRLSLSLGWKPEEEDEAIKLAQMKGVPVERLTLYGPYPEGLIKWYRAEIGLSKVG